jgi:hypothetical protein
MLSVLLLLITIFSSYVVVIAGAVAFELTGLDRETSHFQALSAFTGTGFTTRVAERVVNHPIRRKITIVLIVLGHAGTATVVAGVVTSVNTESLGISLRNIAMLLVAGVGAWYLLRQAGTRLLGDLLRPLLARYMGESVPHEELLLYKPGFGITRIEIPPDCRLAGKSLMEANLRESRLQVLAVESGNRTEAIPDPGWILEPGQHVILYGELKKVQELFRPFDSSKRSL